jgi:hypothetical protein
VADGAFGNRLVALMTILETFFEEEFRQYQQRVEELRREGMAFETSHLIPVNSSELWQIQYQAKQPLRGL